MKSSKLVKALVGSFLALTIIFGALQLTSSSSNAVAAENCARYNNTGCTYVWGWDPNNEIWCCILVKQAPGASCAIRCR